MTEKLKNIIKEELAKLPKENQEAFNAFDWIKLTEEIGQKFLLNENETNDLVVETLLILIGLEDPDLYANNIEEYVGTGKDEAEKIAEEIMEKIFIPINNILLENIKKSGKIKDAKPEQNLNFILSGGDYSAFVNIPPPLSGEDRGEVPNAPHPNPLLKGEGATPRRITDIKNRFTI